MSRVRRDTAPTSRATLSRELPFTKQRSLYLTIRVPSGRLRSATGGASQSFSTNTRGGGGDELLGSRRARNAKKSYVLESDSDEDEDEAMDDVGDDEDADGGSEEEEDEVEEEDEMEMEEDAKARRETRTDATAEVPPPPPIIKKAPKPAKGKAALAVKPRPARKEVRLVENKEAAGSDDEELSELDSEDEEGDKTLPEDAEGEDEEIGIEEDDDEEDDLGSDDDLPGDGSRASTPDLSKLTKRQRARLEEGGSGHLLALPDGMHCLY